MQGPISTSFANFPYEDRVSEGKMDKYRKTDDCRKKRLQRALCYRYTTG